MTRPKREPEKSRRDPETQKFIEELEGNRKTPKPEKRTPKEIREEIGRLLEFQKKANDPRTRLNLAEKISKLEDELNQLKKK